MKLRCLVVSGSLLGHCRKVRSSGTIVCFQLLGGGLAVESSLSGTSNDVVSARTASPSNGRKKAIHFDAKFYSQPHVTSRRAVIGQFNLSLVCFQLNSNFWWLFFIFYFLKNFLLSQTSSLFHHLIQSTPECHLCVGIFVRPCCYQVGG